MTSTAALFALGAVIGGTLAYRHMSGEPQAESPLEIDGGAQVAGAPVVGAVADDRPARAEPSGAGAAPPGPRLDALAALAEANPEQAFAEAMAFEQTPLRRIALERVAREWAGRDAAAAFAALRGIADTESRRAFGAGFYSTLATVDAEAALAYVVRSDVDAVLLAEDAIAMLARQDPGAFVEAIGEVSVRSMRDFLQRALVGGVAETDPFAAVSIAETLPPPPSRQQLRYEIGRQYARKDPGAAVAWALSLPDGGRDALLQAMMGAIAGQDLTRALDIASTYPEAPFDAAEFFAVATSPTGRSSVSKVVTRNLHQLRQVADRLLASQDPRVEAAVGPLLESWSIADPDGALTWMLAQGAAVEPYVSALAAGFAQGRVELSASTVDLLPPESRGKWITEVTAAHVRRDPDAALAWMTRFRGDPEFDAWVSAAARRSLGPQGFNADPMPAVRLLSAATSPLPEAVDEAAARWAALDPAAAAEWVQTLRDPAARDAGIAATARSWAAADADSAARWALGLPAGGARDDALASVVSAQVLGGAVDSGVVSAFSTDARRDAALTSALPALAALARVHASQARAIANAHYTTPELRQAADRVLLARSANPGIR